MDTVQKLHDLANERIEARMAWQEDAIRAELRPWELWLIGRLRGWARVRFSRATGIESREYRDRNGGIARVEVVRRGRIVGTWP